jgi:hypothetical protein
LIGHGIFARVRKSRYNLSAMPPISTMNCADIELALRPVADERYAAQIRLTLPGIGDVSPQHERVEVTFDRVRLREWLPGSAAYARELGAQLFKDPRLWATWREVQVAAAHARVPLRLRLFLPAGAQTLHALHWETLRDPDTGAWLFTGENMRFSRCLALDPRVEPPPQRLLAGVRALVVAPNPAGLQQTPDGRALEPIAPEAELARVRAALGDGRADLAPGTLNGLCERLRAGDYGILVLACHGELQGSEARVWLEDEGGQVAEVEGRELVARLAELPPAKRPNLIVLASCQSGRVDGEPAAGDGGALAALGPQLVMAAGIPAVVAMQGNVTMRTAAVFVPALLREVAVDGVADRAMATARGAVRARPDSWMPVLFLRTEQVFTPVAPQYGMASPRPVDAATLAAAIGRLDALPLDALPEHGPLPPGSHMPFPPNPLFVGREDALHALAAALKGGGTTAIGQVAAATGLGGIGKTQLATEFAHRYGRYFAGGVFWLSFADAAGVPVEIALCGGAFGLRADYADLPVDEQVRLVLSAWQSALPRLLVFDNCEESALLAQWRPPAGGCRVLVTSRRGEWDAALGVQALALDVLARDESRTLLQVPAGPRRGRPRPGRNRGGVGRPAAGAAPGGQRAATVPARAGARRVPGATAQRCALGAAQAAGGRLFPDRARAARGAHVRAELRAAGRARCGRRAGAGAAGAGGVLCAGRTDPAAAAEAGAGRGGRRPGRVVAGRGRAGAAGRVGID